MIFDTDTKKRLRAASAECCPDCGSFDDNAVRDSRLSSSFVLRRRRRCNQCGKAWSTREVKEDGSEQKVEAALTDALNAVDGLRSMLLDALAWRGTK